jgi:uncharacterized protein
MSRLRPLGEYASIFNYVRALLKPVDVVATKSLQIFPFRKRSEHTWRVFTWARRLIGDISLGTGAAPAVDVPPSMDATPAVDMPLDADALLVAALFHDSGYSRVASGAHHAINGAAVFRESISLGEPMGLLGLTAERADFIAYLVANHSNKHMLREKSTPIELVLLMEADILDETGAMSIVWDCLAEGALADQGFRKAYLRIAASGGGVLGDSPMVTPRARAFWAEKQNIAHAFIAHLGRDVAIGQMMEPPTLA